MTVEKHAGEDGFILFIRGKLSALTAEEFGKSVENAIQGGGNFMFDFSDVTYLSSAGLRILVSAKKMLDAQGGSMRIVNANEEVTEVFEITGLDDVFIVD